MNDSVWTVSKVNRHIREQFEYDPDIQGILVEGEISNFTAHSSGHWYFTLKDPTSRLSCVMFKTYAQRSPFIPKHGDKVLIRGSIRVFEPSGQYQLYSVQILPYGEGELNRRFEQLKAKLQQEGLFADSHKKEIPPYPERIGVICGKETAAYRDVVRTVTRRWPVAEIVPFFSLVQGAGAKEMLEETIKKADLQDLDVLLIVRGGGSLEDLWAFNEENVVRAVYAAKTPIITGVGHESDVTLVDYVSDLRASTPTAAAEHATPDIGDAEEILKDLERRLIGRMYAVSDEKHLRLDLLFEKMKHSGRRFSEKNSELSLLKTRLVNSLQNKEKDCAGYLGSCKEHLISAVKAQKTDAHHKFRETVGLLDAYSPLKVLSRGFGAVTDRKGDPVRSVKGLKAGDLLHIRLSDGKIQSEIKETESYE